MGPKGHGPFDPDRIDAYLVITGPAMGSIMLWAAISCAAFLAFFGLLIMGLLKRADPLVGAAIVALLIAVGSGVAAVREANDLAPAVSTPVVPRRSGSDIYRIMFGPSPTGCVSVTHHRDRLVPDIDKGVRIRVRTCAAELERLLRTGAYRTAIGPASSIPRPDATAYVSGDFDPAVLGDTVRCLHVDATTRGPSRWIYTRLDSSEMIAVDLFE